MRAAAFSHISVATALALLVVVAAAADGPRKKGTRPTRQPEKQSPSSTMEAKRAVVVAKLMAETEAGQVRQYLSYIGTRIDVAPDLEGAPAAVQQALARRLASLDPRPEGRLAHFRWLVQHPDLRCNGWYGRLQGIIPSPGGFLLEVAFSPQLALPDGGDTQTEDEYLEVYEYSRGGFRFVKGAGSPVATQFLILN